MFKKILLPTILIILSYGFWISPNFKEISSGIAIFLFGMLSLEEGFRAFSGGILEQILQKSTDKLYKSIGFGIITTTIMQSSSLVSVLTISFLGAGLIGLTQGIGIILGANIGTTSGAWLMATFGLKVKISAYAMPMLVFGVIFIFQKNKQLKGIGYILSGLGFLFLGISYMKEGFEALKNAVDLSSFAIGGFSGLLIFIGIGILATIIMQSSHATIVIILAALSVGQITYENALALTIGANIGTTITAIIGSLSSNIDGKRLAAAHFIFNMITAVIAVVILHQMIYVVDIFSGLVGIGGDNHTLKLAVFDTLFKVMGVVIFLPFIAKLVKFLESTFKEDIIKSGIDTVRYLNDSVLELPATSLAAIIRETKHLYDNTFEIICQGLNLKEKNIASTISISEVIKDSYSDEPVDIEEYYENRIKGIYSEIVSFATKAQASMTPSDIDILYKIKLANRDLVEALKATKHLQKNLLKYTKSTNVNIKEQYDIIRKNLAELLRNMNIIATTDEDHIKMVLLSKIKVTIEKQDVLTNGTIDTLIRNSLITNTMASSLMNDSYYAYEIGKNLVAMAEVIFMDVRHFTAGVGMSSEDVKEITERKG